MQFWSLLHFDGNFFLEARELSRLNNNGFADNAQKEDFPL